MNKSTLKIEYVRTEILKEYENNAKLHPQEQIDQIKKSITEFGMNDPIAIWKDNIIIEGHGRLIACKQLNIEIVPIIRLDNLTDDQRKAYTLIHNQTTMNTGFDIDILNEELANINLDMSEFGFDIELDDIEEEQEIVEDEVPEVPEVPEEPKAKLGDIYQLGNHRLMCGDSTNEEDVTKLMNGVKANMVFTDPPYNVAYEGGSKKREMIKNDKIDNFYDFLYDVYLNCYNFMNDGAPIYVCHSELERVNFTQAFLDVGFKMSSIIIWAKNNSTFSMNKDYKQKHEPIIYGWKDGKHKWVGGNCEDTLWEIKRPVKSDLHPTMKPIELCARAINNSSNKNNIIYEPFGGSGSTLIASEQTNRKCYMMELDPHYIDVIIQRWENFTGKKAMKLN